MGIPEPEKEQQRSLSLHCSWDLHLVLPGAGAESEGLGFMGACSKSSIRVSGSFRFSWGVLYWVWGFEAEACIVRSRTPA